MTKTVKAVEITFENLDYAVIPAHYYCNFSISHIKTEIRRVAVNAILKTEVAAAVEFELLQCINAYISDLEHEIYALSPEYSLFDRLLDDNHITLLTVIYADGSEERYYVPWEDAEQSEYQNRLQHAYITDAGDMCVSIRES